MEVVEDSESRRKHYPVPTLLGLYAGIAPALIRPHPRV